MLSEPLRPGRGTPTGGSAPLVASRGAEPNDTRGYATRREPRGRLIVVSPRVGTHEHVCGWDGAAARLLAERGGVWLGWSGELSDRPRTQVRLEGRSRRLLRDLREQDFQAWSARFTEGGLRPLLDGHPDEARFDEADFLGYCSVNRQLAELLADIATRDDLVWVQGFALMPMAALLRGHDVRCRIGFTPHAPLPDAASLAAVPQHASLFGALASFDVVGLGTHADRRALATYLSEQFGASALSQSGMHVLRDGRRTRLVVPHAAETDADPRAAWCGAFLRALADGA